MAIIDFEIIKSDLESLNAIDIKEKWGIEKNQLKSILDGLWLQKLNAYSKENKNIALQLVIELAKSNDVKFYDIPNKELFKTGYHNGKTYNKQDIQEIAKNTQSMMQDFNLKCPIKLGHDDDQVLASELKKEFSELLNSDGMPSFGYVENIKADNGVLKGDFKSIPEPLYNLIQKGMFEKRSAEIFLNYEDGKGNKIGKVFSAIALLGAEQPAIPDLYSKNECKDNIFFGEPHMTIQPHELEVKLATEQAEKAELKKRADELQAELEAAKKEASEAKAAIEQEKLAARKVSIDAKVDSLLASQLILPFEKESVRAIFDKIHDEPQKLKFTKADGSNEEKSLTEVFTGMLENRKKVDLFKQYGHADNPNDQTKNLTNLDKEAIAVFKAAGFTDEQIKTMIN